MDIYQQELIDHYRHPRNKGTLAQPYLGTTLHNPSCGDSVSLSLRIHDGVVIAMVFEGTGCVISQAAASLLTVYCKGKSVEVVKQIDSLCMQQLVGVSLGPVRIKCALLALDALQEILVASKENCVESHA